MAVRSLLSRFGAFGRAFFTLHSPPVKARSLVLESFHADIRVTPEGQVVVTETLRPRFSGAWNGIIRFIPVVYRSPMGFNYRIWLELESISDASGNPLRYKSSREGHFRRFQIWVPGARDSVKTIVLRYRVDRALLFFEEHDELYWNVTGDEGAIPVEAASAQIELPAGTDGVRVSAFTGSRGSRQQAVQTSIEGNRIQVRTTRSLGIREGLTVAVAWSPGMVARPTLIAKASYFLIDNWLFGIPVLVFALLYLLWYRRGRDPERRPIAVRYEPPSDLTPAEAGTLIDHSPDMRDIMATLVELAVQGYIYIRSSGSDYRFTLRKPRPEWQTLLPHQRKVLQGLFSSRQDSVSLSELKNEFYTFLPDIKEEIFGGLIAKRFYARRPDRVMLPYLFAGAGIALYTLVAAVQNFFGMTSFSIAISGLATTAVVAAFGLLMPARTVAGTRALEEVLGFEEFLQRVESDRYKRMISGPEMFERYLPYAVALGVDEQWAAAFADLVRQPPDWYSGAEADSFQIGVFVEDFNQMKALAFTALTSAPRSVGDSAFDSGGGWDAGGGFDAGGFSGGGFGGGGTSGF